MHNHYRHLNIRYSSNKIGLADFRSYINLMTATIIDLQHQDIMIQRFTSLEVVVQQLITAPRLAPTDPTSTSMAPLVSAAPQFVIFVSALSSFALKRPFSPFVPLRHSLVLF
ncbi:hypothetical protein OWV82_001690 [Melia azedarach]|uniref:Uncharacterized protein n=1 Tax=Melia azedarach TaxID=155640 RepID=A0ACC1YYT7_MELAZ|nr:hypothetical protein OWV82_001690 [Melia azedarach]